MQNLDPKSLTAAAYIPTAPRTGGEGGYLYRMKNMILHGAPSHDYLQVYGGNKNLSENIGTLAGTGTVSGGGATLVLTGTGTIFQAELRPGQFILLSGAVANIASVDEVLSQTSLTFSSLPGADVTAAALTRVPRIFEVNKKRGTLITGNAIQFDKGTIICVGSGTLRLNGSTLAGTSLVATKHAQIALFNPLTSTYTVFPLGMATPATLTAARVAGPFPKNMLPGLYSLFVCPARQATTGYNNPSPKAEVTLTTLGDRVQLTLPAADTANGQDAWRIYASTYTEQGGTNGPWYFVKQIKTPGDVATAGGTYDLEWNDAEISNGELLSFDNDVPVDADFVATVAGYPVYVSCQGPGYSISLTSATNANPVVFTMATPHYFSSGQVIRMAGGTGAWAAVNGDFVVTVLSATTFSIAVNSGGFGAVAGTITATSLSTAPGPFIVPSKPNNIEAAPLKWAVAPSPPESILGCISAVERLFLMTANTLQVADLIPGLTDPNIPPLIIRPFWRAGFKHWNQLCFVDGELYGYTTQGPTRSIAFGDVGSEKHTFAAAVREITDGWKRANVFVGHDPINNAVCFFHSNDTFSSLITTRVLMYGLDRQAWIGDIILSDPDNDMGIGGVATVNGRLEFLAGGRLSGGGTQFRTYHFDAQGAIDGGAGTAVPWYAAWQFSDDGMENRDKLVKSIRVTGKITSSATAGIHGAGATEVIDVTVLEAGNSGSKSGSIPLAATTAVAQGPRIPLNVPNLGVWTVRVDDTWDGASTMSRLDEVVIERAVGGCRR